MKVQRVQTEHGSHIEPWFDETWSLLEQLQWHAAVVEADTGLVVSISQGGLRVNGVEVVDYYSWSGGSAGGGLGGFNQAWAWLNGVSRGYEMTKAQLPDWSEVVEGNLRAELATARADLEAEQIAEVFMATLYTSALRHVEDERDRARSVATQLEQEVHALTVGSGRRVL